MLERQTVATVQGPSELAKPHLLSFTSHLPLAQIRVPAPALQVPSTVTSLCVGSAGMAVPLTSWAVHTCVPSLHHFPAVQSASALHPPAGSHFELLLQAPERQTASVAALHGPSPTG